MGYAILRIEPRTVSGAHRMLRHALREDVPPNAIEGAPAPSPLGGHATAREGMQQVRAAIQEAKDAKKWQKSVKPVLDVLVTFSRDDLERLSLEQQNAYFADALKFVGASFGGAQNVLTACVHRDESTAHMQVLVLAQHADKRLSSSRYMGNRTQLSELQDDFHSLVGSKYGLMRGQKRSGAKHVPVRALYGAMNAGAEPPTFREVPAEPTMGERLRMNGYQKEALLKTRQEAIEHNNAERKRVLSQAEFGRKIHPSLIAHQANRYREASRQADLAQKEAQEALKTVSGAKEEAEAMERYLRQADARLMAKNKEISQLDADIDRLRKLRDREGDNGYEA